MYPPNQVPAYTGGNPNFQEMPKQNPPMQSPQLPSFGGNSGGFGGQMPGHGMPGFGGMSGHGMGQGMMGGMDLGGQMRNPITGQMQNWHPGALGSAGPVGSGSGFNITPNGQPNPAGAPQSPGVGTQPQAPAQPMQQSPWQMPPWATNHRHWQWGQQGQTGQGGQGFSSGPPPEAPPGG